MGRLAAMLLLATISCTGAVEPDPIGGWVEIAPMEVARSEHPGVVLDGEVVVLGGFIEVGIGRSGVTDTVEAYDPTTDSWRDLPRLPEPVNHGMAAVVAGRLVVMGGYSVAGEPVDSVWELVDGTWVDLPPLPAPVAAGAAVAVGDSIFLVGGAPDGGLLRYDPTQNSWDQLSGPDQKREHLAAVSLDGEIWAIAGRWQGEIFNTIEIYDAESGTWRPGPSLGEARSGFGAAVVDGTIVVAGGEVFEPNQALSSVERLDVASAKWSHADPLPYGLHGNPLVAIGSDLYLPGGSTQAAGVENDGRSYRLHSD